MKFKKQKNKLVINIKNDSVQFCVGKFDYTDVYVDKLFKVKPDFNIYEDGLIKDENLLSKLISDELKKQKIQEKDCYLYILSPDSIRKKITVPYIENDNDFNDLVHTELSQVLPVSFDDYIVKYKLINESKKNELLEVSLNCVLMNKEIVNSYKKILKICKLNPAVLDLNSSSIENLIKFLIMSHSDTAGLVNREIENTVTAFIEIGGEYCSISVFKSGIVDFNRIIKIVDIDKDLYTLINFININNSLNENNEIYEFSNKLLSEINLFLEYYSNRTTTNEIKEIFIYGDHCDAYGIKECAENIFNTPVNTISIMKGIKYDDSIIVNDIGEYVNTIGGLIRW